MPFSRLPAASLLIALLLPSPALWAQTPQTLEEAAAQRARAEQMRDAAEKNFVAEQQACYDKFLVNSCLDDAKKRRTAALIEARNVDIPAREFQREAKRAEVDAKDQKRAAEAPRRAAEEQAQAESFRAEEAIRAAEREKKVAEKARMAAEGRQKTAADQARQKEKQQQRAQRDAEITARKAQDAAKP
jgi:colicin import membrane protein